LKGLAKPNLAPPKLTTPRTKRSEASEAGDMDMLLPHLR
jgi:hypothetical protein